MYFLLSGEGPTDLGEPKSTTRANKNESFSFGPMAIFVDQVFKKKFHYSFLESGMVEFVSKQQLIEGASEFKAAKKSLSAPGKKRAKETRYFFNNARVLARFAKNKQEQIDGDVVAILFRDADGTASSDRGLWETKWQSMLDGFQEEQFHRGVPMIPKPKSEARLICA